jgi:hypothetical protein
MLKTYTARKVVRGVGEGAAIICPASFSFLGDVDLASGEIIAQGNPNRGLRLQGRVLVYREAKGSSGGCVVLLTLAKQGLAPAAIMTVMPADYNLTEGAILAGIPFVCQPDGDVLGELATGQRLRVDADAGTVSVLA